MSPAEINALLDRVRLYIAHIETEADPAGTLAENFRLREENANLRRECENLAAGYDIPSPGGAVAYGVKRISAKDVAGLCL